MGNLESETKFFHGIAEAVLDLLHNASKEMAVVEDKGIGDYSTQVDIDVENLIVSELYKVFPNDKVLAEEGYSDTEIPHTRIWVIDPICGTNNLGKGINNYCTNIALVDENQVIASCVIDHSQQEYFWSVGNNKVYVNHQVIHQPAEELGLKIDIDFGSVRRVTKDMRLKHNTFLLKIIEDTNYDVISLNTSLGFAYTALGKTDGFVNVFNHPWDICAASFLIQQSGGVITAIDGSPWTIVTVGAIAGRTPAIQKDLLDLFVSSY